MPVMPSPIAGAAATAAAPNVRTDPASLADLLAQVAAEQAKMSTLQANIQQLSAAPPLPQPPPATVQPRAAAPSVMHGRPLVSFSPSPPPPAVVVSATAVLPSPQLPPRHPGKQSPSSIVPYPRVRAVTQLMSRDAWDVCCDRRFGTFGGMTAMADRLPA
jgi:hypothetical protein